MSEKLNYEWAAGFYSAEGWTTIDKVSGRKYVGLCIEQINKEPLEKFRDVFDFGTVIEIKRRNSYLYRTRSQKDIDVLLNLVWEMLAPIKQEQALNNIKQYRNDPKRVFEFEYTPRQVQMPKNIGIPWAAGFWEGDGTISNTKTSLMLRVIQSIPETLELYGQAVGAGHLSGPYSKVGMRPQGTYGEWINWYWTIHTNALDYVEAFWPWLSETRRRQIRHICEKSNILRKNKLTCRDFMYTTNS